MKGMISRRFDVPFGVVLLPSLQQLNPDSLRRFVEHYGLQDQGCRPDAPARTTARTGFRGVTVLDVLPRLRSVSGARLHFPDDGHLTARAPPSSARRWRSGWPRVSTAAEIMPAASPATGVSE